MKDKFLIGLFLLTVCIASAMFYLMKSDRNGLSVSQGILDLSGWDYRNHDVLTLNGEWEFYANRLLVPGSPLGTEKDRSFIQVPGKWDGWQDGKGSMMKGKVTAHTDLSSKMPRSEKRSL